MLTLSTSILSFSPLVPSLFRHSSSFLSNRNISSGATLPSQITTKILNPRLKATSSSPQATRSESKLETEHQFFSSSSPDPSSFPMAMASSTFSPKSTLYDTLGITSTATCHEIKAAYRRLARACHPDVVSVGQKDSSANQFMKIHSAYLTLSDPSKRAGYDRELFVTRLRPGSYRRVGSGPGSGFTTSRNWETDQCW